MMRNNPGYYIFIIFTTMLSSMVQADIHSDLIKQGKQAFSDGYYHQAKVRFEQAHALAITDNDDYQRIVSQGLLGDLAIQQQQFDVAEQLLTDALQTIDGDTWPQQKAKLELYLGKLHQKLNQIVQAEAFFQRAAVTSKSAKAPLIRVSSHLYLASNQVDKQTAWQHLQQAYTILLSIVEPLDTLELWLNLGYQTQKNTNAKQTSDQLELVYIALNNALQLARKQKQTKIEILALTYLGGLYEHYDKVEDALSLTNQAISLAQSQNNHDLLINLEWRLGRIYSQKNQLKHAVGAYRRTISHIEAIT